MSVVYTVESERALQQAIKEIQCNLSFPSSQMDPTIGPWRERSFIASTLSLDLKTQQTAVFYIMNTSRNRNRWAVTDRSLEQALPTLKGKSIGLGAGYKTDKHYPAGETIDVGKFIAAEKPGSYALATAEFQDPKTWELMKAGTLRAISVVIYSHQDTCSKCGCDLSSIRDPYGQHQCLAAAGSSAYVQVDSFVFKRVDFVDIPAYSQAGLLEMSAAGPASYQRALELAANYYERQYSAIQLEALEKAIQERRNQLGFDCYQRIRRD